MFAHANEAVPPFSRKNPNNSVPAAAEKVIRDGMEKSPTDRPPTAGEFAARFCVALGLPAPRYSSAKPVERNGTPSRPVGKWAVVFVVGNALGVGVALFFPQFRS